MYVKIPITNIPENRFIEEWLAVQAKWKITELFGNCYKKITKKHYILSDNRGMK
jgi:hypothetical protein